MSTTWEEVEVPQGTFIGWGTQPGQTVTLKVHDFSNDGGTDFNDKPCPRIIGELTEPADSYKEKGTVKVNLPAGELVTLNCGQANLARNVRAAQPEPGDMIRITFASLEKGTRGDIKIFKTQIARATHAPADGDLI